MDSHMVTNIKPHLARNHAVDLCYGVCCTDDEKVHSSAFLSNLHVFCKTLESLRSHGYNILPACHFFSQRFVMHSVINETFETTSLC